MAFTQFKKFSAQAYNSANNSWGANGSAGVDLNTGLISLVDYALGGISTFTNPSGAISLSFTAGGGGDVQNVFWSFTGTITAGTTITTAAGDATTYLNGYYFWSNTTSGSFTLTLTTANGSVVLPQGRRGILFVNNVNSVAPFIVAIAGSSSADPIPAGSKTLFYNTAAPAGWTAVALNDYAIKIVTTGAGGVTSGSVAYSTLYARTGTDAVTLSAANMPTAATYSKVTTSGAASAGSPNYSIVASVAETALTGAASTPFTPAIDMRVNTAAFTLASKD